MAYRRADRVFETGAVSGTGNVTPQGAYSGQFRTFASTMNDGDTTTILIVNTAANEWEICDATRSGSTLVRGTLLGSNTGARVSFGGGTKHVMMTNAAGRVAYFEPDGYITNPYTGGGLRLANNVRAVGLADQIIIYENLASNIRNGLGTSSGAFDIRSVSLFKFWAGGVPQLLADLGSTGLYVYLDRLRLERPASAGSYLDFVDVGAGQAKINKETAASNSILDLNPKANDGTGQALFRVFRETVTTGSRQFIVCFGDGTAGASHVLASGPVASFVCGDAASVFGIGRSTPLAKAHVYGPGEADERIATHANYGATVYIQDSGNQTLNGGILQFGAAQGAFAGLKGLIASGTANTQGHLSVQTRRATSDVRLTECMRFQADGHIAAGVDNAQNLGLGTRRWAVVYAGTGTINTSGREEKNDIRAATDAEKRAAARIKANPRCFRYNDAVAAKGETARLHWGYIHEDVRDALIAEGLDPYAYGFMCADPVMEQETYTETVTRTKMETYEAQEERIVIDDEGRAIATMVTVERQREVGIWLPIYDAQGNHAVDAEGQPRWHFQPETEEQEVQSTREIDTGRVRYGLRYSELEAFLRCAD